MFRLLLFLSLVPIVGALLAKWWFGTRVLALDGNRPCRCDLARWLPAPGDTATLHRADAPAAEFGRQLRLKALDDWRKSDPKAAASREKSQRFGMAVPPLSGIVAVFAVVVGKLPVVGALAILTAAAALAAVFGILTLAPEIAAINRYARRVRDTQSIPGPDDQDAVIRCAQAHAWEHALPPILRGAIR